tara:strand:+ start:60 stop:1232 length:1173 start_codon:yes stop_codon:yes gene_type:complete
MSILDKVSKETLQSVKMVFPRKKTGDIISSYGTNAWNITVEHRMFLQTLREYYNNNNSKFNPDALPYGTITRTMFTLSSLIYQSCVGLYGEKRNILVIPNWKENEHDALYDVANTTPDYNSFNPTHNFTPDTILTSCLWPIWKRQVNGYHSITIALPNEYTLLEKVLVDYGFEHKIARQSKLYELGENTYSGFTVNKIPSHLEKFDVVQLIGHDRPEEGKVFKAEDIKDDFKRYCKDDFLLHDLWRPDFNLKDGLTKTWGDSWYRGIEGTPNEEAIQSLKEFKSYQQSMDWGFVLADNNDSDMSKIMEEGFCNANPYLMHSDSDISNSTMISARDRKAEIAIEKYGLDSSTNLKDLINNGQHHAGFGQMFREASRMAYERTKRQQFIPIF